MTFFTGCASTKLQVEHGECKYTCQQSTPNILLRNYESQRLQMVPEMTPGNEGSLCLHGDNNYVAH